MPKIRVDPDLPYQLFNEDCFETFKRIKDNSIDLVLVDPPYGTTQCKWDAVIPLSQMWNELIRVSKGAVIFTAGQPFSSVLVASCLSLFRYEYIWEKSKASNFLLARKQPLKAHEQILVFSKNTPKYYPQKTNGKPYKGEGRSLKGSKTDLVNDVPNPTFRNDNKGDRFPRTVQYFVTAENEGCLHPTQKPIALMEYLLKTHSDETDIVLDFSMGSGTTGAACGNLSRKFIGCDSDKEHGYFEIAEKRIKKAYNKNNHAQTNQ